MPHRSNLQLFLGRLTSRSLLHTDEQQAILDLPAYASQVSGNQDFVCLGETSDFACLVAAGLVGRFGQNAEGGRQITALHIPGDMADLHSVVQPRAGSALQALTTTTILRIPHDAIRRVAARYPAVAEAFWRDCMVDAAILSQWVVNVGRRNARTRMAHLICEAATRSRKDGESQALTFQLPMTQAHLADSTGMTAVHVNRTLKSLVDVVKFSGSTVHIHDWDRLAATGEFDPGYLQIAAEPAERLRIAEPA
ncbi:MAG: Crp/Fnr family transcriptional regulator [Brevundimonas sp.]